MDISGMDFGCLFSWFNIILPQKDVKIQYDQYQFTRLRRKPRLKSRWAPLLYGKN